MPLRHASAATTENGVPRQNAHAITGTLRAEPPQRDPALASAGEHRSADQHQVEMSPYEGTPDLSALASQRGRAD